MTKSLCRCGRDTDTSHPCHAGAYTCAAEGTHRFYVTRFPAALAGLNPKAQAADTWACDKHWAEFSALIRA